MLETKIPENLPCVVNGFCVTKGFIETQVYRELLSGLNQIIDGLNTTSWYLNVNPDYLINIETYEMLEDNDALFDESELKELLEKFKKFRAIVFGCEGVDYDALLVHYRELLRCNGDDTDNDIEDT